MSTLIKIKENPIMITLNLNPELENKIQEEAKLKGLTLEQYLQDIIEQTLKNQPQKSSQILEYEEWERKLTNFINRPSNINAQALSDEAISRESIYTREEAQLFVGWVSGSVTHAGVGFHASTQPTFILYLIPPTYL